MSKGTQGVSNSYLASAHRCPEGDVRPAPPALHYLHGISWFLKGCSHLLNSPIWASARAEPCSCLGSCYIQSVNRAASADSRHCCSPLRAASSPALQPSKSYPTCRSQFSIRPSGKTFPVPPDVAGCPSLGFP